MEIDITVHISGVELKNREGSQCLEGSGFSCFAVFWKGVIELWSQHVSCTNPQCESYGIKKTVVSAQVLGMNYKICPHWGSHENC